MANITMTIDNKILKKVRKIAVEKNTTLTALVRNFLNHLAYREDLEKELVIKQLKKSFDNALTVIGKKTWTRDDLHDRQVFP